VLGFLMLGCEDEEHLDLPEISWSSKEFDFATDSGEQICGGSLLFQQGFVKLLQGVFGAPQEGAKFTYYLLSLESFYEKIGEDVLGLYNNRRVFETVVPEFHEVTHAVVDLSIGISHPAFNEGIAEVFRDRYGYNDDPERFSLAHALQFDGVDEKFPAEAYGRAGHFMSYSLDVHGVAATVELLALARPGDAPEVLEEKLAVVFGMNAAEIFEDYLAYPLCRHDTYRWPIAECALGPRVDPVDGFWSIEADMDCGDQAVLGSRDGQVLRVNVVEVAKAGLYQIAASGEDGAIAVVELGHCSPGCAPDKGIEVEVGTQQVVELRQGRYHVTFENKGRQTGYLNAQIAPVDLGMLSPG
jgi:hypothetical protein